METTLKEINAVLGVMGSFVCASDGNLVANAMPGSFTAPQLALAARVANQFFQALEASGQRAAEMDLQFGQRRLVLKTLRGGILAILCARNINLPLLNLTVNVAVKKIAAELKASRAPAPSAEPLASAPAAKVAAPAPATAAPAAVSAPAETPVVASADNPLFLEFYEEARHIIDEGKPRQLDLRVMESIAVWYSISRARSILASPGKRQIVLGGRSAQANGITALMEELGYKPNQRFNAFYGSRRLNFSRAEGGMVVDVHLDAFSMFHRFELNGYVNEDEFAASITVLLLTRLQMVEWCDAGLRELCALLLERDLSVGNEKGKIDASYITRLCAEDWGWFKTVSINLDRVSALAPTMLKPEDRPVVVERAQRLKQSIVNAPKSLRWQTRARLGESMRWYETPIVDNPTARPDLAIG